MAKKNDRAWRLWFTSLRKLSNRNYHRPIQKCQAALPNRSCSWNTMDAATLFPSPGHKFVSSSGRCPFNSLRAFYTHNSASTTKNYSMHKPLTRHTKNQSGKNNSIGSLGYFIRPIPQHGTTIGRADSKKTILVAGKGRFGRDPPGNTQRSVAVTIKTMDIKFLETNCTTDASSSGSHVVLSGVSPDRGNPE